MDHNVFTISISSPAGGGKTTITNLLKDKLKECKTIYFDDYEFQNDKGDNQFNENLVEYDYNKWELAPLIKDIEKTIIDNNYKYILLDYPFGRANSNFNKYLNYCVFIDTPLDIAMARRIIRDYNVNSNIIEEMSAYLKYGRIGYLDMLKKVKPTCDLIINGENEPKEIVNKIMENIIIFSQR